MKTDFYEAAQKFLLKPDSVNSMRAVALLATFNCLRPVNLPKMQSTLLLLLFIAILLPNISHGPKPESDELLNTSVGKKPAFDWLKSLWAKQKGEPALEILPFLHIKRNQKWHTALKRETAGISEVVDSRAWCIYKEGNKMKPFAIACQNYLTPWSLKTQPVMEGNEVKWIYRSRQSVWSINE